MPWTPSEFIQRHNHGLNKKQGAKAARQASAMVKAGVPEGVAIATANKHAKDKPKGRRADRWYGKG